MKAGELTTIKALGLDGERSFSARPLSFDEIQRLLVQARTSDWIGNPALVDFVVECGLSNRKLIKSVSRDRFLGFNVGREIWTLTLRNLAAETRRLMRVAGVSRIVPRVQRYRFIDLLTPGLLQFLLLEMEELDVEGFSRAMLATFVLEVRLPDGTSVQPREFIAENFDLAVPFVLRAIGLDKNLTKGMPKTVLKTAAQRFFVALHLAPFLDWAQYNKIVRAYNVALRELCFRSNQLGGADTTRKETAVITGFPLFPELIKPVSKIPLEVAIRLLGGARRNSLIYFSREHKRQVLACFEAAQQVFAKHALEVDQEILQAGPEMVLLMAFVREINRHPKLVQESCFVYMDAYCDFFNRRLHREIEKHKEDERYLDLPDVYLLVEGPSDEVYFQRFIELMDTGNVRIAVEACGGTGGVSRRALDLRNREPYAGGVVAIFDADARKQEEDLARSFAEDRYVAILRFPSGVIEDQFPAVLHCKVLNELFPEGEPVTPEDLTSKEDMGRALSKALWTRKRARFDKRSHAKTLVEQITHVEDIPPNAKEFVYKAFEVGQRRRAELPKPVSHLSVDNFKKIFQAKLAAEKRKLDSA